MDAVYQLLISSTMNAMTITMYRGMTHYEFILALHTVLSSYKTHYKFRFLYFYITKPYIFLHFALIVCFCELSTVSKNKHEHIVCHCPVHGDNVKSWKLVFSPDFL